VKYFSIGPNYIDRIGRTMSTWQDKPFYWIGPDDKQKCCAGFPSWATRSATPDTG